MEVPLKYFPADLPNERFPAAACICQPKIRRTPSKITNKSILSYPEGQAMFLTENKHFLQKVQYHFRAARIKIFPEKKMPKNAYCLGRELSCTENFSTS